MTPPTSTYSDDELPDLVYDSDTEHEIDSEEQGSDSDTVKSGTSDSTSSSDADDDTDSEADFSRPCTPPQPCTTLPPRRLPQRTSCTCCLPPASQRP